MRFIHYEWRNMRKFLCFLLTIGCIYAQDWTMGGFEIMGNKTLTRQQVKEFYPISPQAIYTQKNAMEYFERLISYNKKLQEKYDLQHVESTIVSYLNFKFYVVVDIVEKSEKQRVQFRKSPQKHIKFATKEILDLYQALQERQQQVFAQGKAVNEIIKNAKYRDYDDPQMHQIVSKLVERVPAHRENILHVLQHSNNSLHRMQAATLLNWALDPIKTIAIVHTFLDDPSGGVRNNISRFMIPFTRYIQDKKLTRAIIDSLVIQLNRPSHGDRNKALYSLLTIAENSPQNYPYILKKSKSLLQYIADNSILENVQKPAQDLLSKAITNK